MSPIIFFDSKCGFCNRCVLLLLYLDTKKRLKFAPNDGITAKNFLPQPILNDRLIFLDDQGISDGAVAFLRALDYLPWTKFLFYPVKLLPISFLNKYYDTIAKHRYKCKIKPRIISDDRLLP